MKGLIFTYALTYVGSVVALFNPFVGVLIYVCFAILRPESLWHWAVPPGNYSRTIAIALLLGWMVRGFGDWRLGRASWTVVALLSFLTWSIFSSFFANKSSLALSFVEDVSKIVLPFIVGVTTLQTVKQLRILAWVILLSQGFVALELNLAYFDGRNLIHEQGFGGVDNNCVAIAMVTCSGLALFVGINESDWRPKLFALGTCVLMVHCVFLSFSRGGMLAMTLTSVFSFFLLPKRPVHYLVFALIIAVGVRLAGPQVVARFSTTFADKSQRDDSADGRTRLWANCWDVMLNNPIAGVGPRHWPLTAVNYGWPIGKEAHSLWMQTGAELGFPGLFFLSGFYGLTVLRLWPLARQRVAAPDPWLASLAQGVIASIIGFMISAQFVSLIGLEVPYYIVLIGAGILKLQTRPHTPDQVRNIQRPIVATGFSHSWIPQPRPLTVSRHRT